MGQSKDERIKGAKNHKNGVYGANEQMVEVGSIQQVATLPRPGSFVVFRVIPALINTPVPLVTPFIVGRVCSNGYHPDEPNPRLRARIWFGGFSMITVTIPKAAILEWHRFRAC